ncbi:MAG TPA: YceI family protein [Polyangiaceae bacterium]|nr:YceI family protein [Polyangiaceae bacterium]
MRTVHASKSAEPRPASQESFRLDALRTRVAFSVRHMTGRVHGAFMRLSGSVDYDARRPENTAVQVTIQSASVVTHSAARDARVRSSGFLDVRAFPEITFASTSARRCRRSLEVTGQLTIHGVSRPVTVTVGKMQKRSSECEPSEGRGSGISAVARARVRRTEFGVGPNSEHELVGLMIGDEVAIELDIELVRQ